MADFDTPTLDSLYTDFATEIRANDTANAVMFNGVTVSNIPVGAIQFAGGVFGTWNGASFDVTPVVIGGGGTGATTAAGARTNLGISSTTEANGIYMKILSNGSDINDVSIFRTNLVVPSNAEASLNADNLASLANASTSFDNIKQSATELSEGVVEKATALEMRSGSVGKYPDASTIVTDRTPVSIWTGSSLSISEVDILASSGFAMIAGDYYLKTANGNFMIPLPEGIPSASDGTGRGTHNVTNGLGYYNARWTGSAFTAELLYNNGVTSGNSITEILFKPL